MDEQEHSVNPETPDTPDGAQAPGTPAAPASGPATPATGPAAGPGRERRADGVREALTSRGAGWAVAAAMTGAVVGLSVAMATSSSPTVVVQPDGAAGLRGTPPGAARAPVPGGAVSAQSPARLRIQAPARAQVPMRLRAQIPAGLPLQAPVRLRVQVPVRLPLQSPARLRLASPVAGPAGTLIPAPRIRVAAGQPVPAAVLTPRALRLHVRPTRVRVRFRIPASARIQVLPG
ncbi:MAG TPA: hypothetical protein VGY50_04980, partial [Streptosporangiaceae bacterium]|nr:hypothetical protein [Streptosporangiaceae bacterium]